MHPDAKSGELGYRIGKSIWEDPSYRKLMGLPPGKPFDTYKPEVPLGYYKAGDNTGQSFGVLMSDQNAGPSNITTITPALAAWRAKHPGQDYPAGGGGGYRRMNVGNVRALRRSMRRVQGFAKMAKKVMTFTAHHKMKKRGRR